MESLSIEKLEKNNTIMLKLAGTLNRAAAEPLLAQTGLLSRHKQQKLQIDFTNLKHISGEGMMLLINFCTRAAYKGFLISVTGIDDSLLSVFDLTRLSKAVPVSYQKDLTRKANQGWSQPITTVRCCHPPEDALNLNVHNRELTSPLHGFGRMWLRNYRVDITGDTITPEYVMLEWKKRFSEYWPPGNAIYMPQEGIYPGAVGLINLAMPMGINLATGATVIYEDDTSFTLMTVQGHMFSGFINFSTYEENNRTYAQTQALVRPNDLLYEMSFWVGFGPKSEDNFWIQTLKNLAHHIRSKAAERKKSEHFEVELDTVLIDHTIQWRAFKNIWYNAGVRSFIYQITHPFQRSNPRN